MAEISEVLEKSAQRPEEASVTQAYFAILHADHPETGESQLFFMKGKSGNKLRIFGGEADSQFETPKDAILRETAEEAGFIDQETGAVKNAELYGQLHDVLDAAFSNPDLRPIFSKDHDLTAEEITKGWHPSQNHVYEIACDYSLLVKMQKVSENEQTPEGFGTCLLSASQIMQDHEEGFRHPFENAAIGIHFFGETQPEKELDI